MRQLSRVTILSTNALRRRGSEALYACDEPVAVLNLICCSLDPASAGIVVGSDAVLRAQLSWLPLARLLSECQQLDKLSAGDNLQSGIKIRTQQLMSRLQIRSGP